jgi:cytochrome P450
VGLGGATIAEDEKVLMLLGAANRDPRQWREPARYNIDPETTAHVGFGAGVRMCVGQLLPRFEGETLLAALARAFATLAPEGERSSTNTLRGWARLPLWGTPV